MTNEEAIKTIEYNCYVLNPLDFDRTTMINTALDMARDALSKQIAKKWNVLKRNGDDIEIECPECRSETICIDSKEIINHKYCNVCGQRLEG